MVLASLILAGLFTYINVVEYIESTTVTSINTTTASLRDITFPSLVICNVNQVTTSFLEEIDVGVSDDEDKKLLFDQFLKGYQQELSPQSEAKLQTLLDRIRLRFGWSEKKAFYTISSQNCSDMILSGIFRGYARFARSAPSYSTLVRCNWGKIVNMGASEASH